MNLTLTSDLLAFAEERKEVQDRHEKDLLGSARYALRRHGERGWYTALLDRAAALLRKQYHADTGQWTSPALRAAQKDFRDAIRETLDKTTKPEDNEALLVSARLIAASIATDATNLAAELAAQDDTEDDGDMVFVKTWVSMEDAKVRPTHADAHGQSVPLNGQFTVGGSKMDRPGDLTAPIGEWANCRCLLAITAEEPQAIAASLPPGRASLAQDTDPTGGDMDDDTQVEEEFDDMPEAPAEPMDFADDPVPFWGVLAPEDVESGDGRKFAADSLRSRPLPLPLAYQRVNEPGHDGSVKVANIERTWRRDGMAFGSGHFLTSVPEAGEAVAVMWESGGRMGVSVDADDGAAEMVTRDGRSLDSIMEEMEPGDSVEMDMDDLLTVFTTARISGATLCNIPAFHQAFIAIGEVPEEFAPEDGDDLAIEARSDALVAAPGTQDGPGWLTHPVDTDRLRDYWVHGKGAAKIGWGAPGDFNRCRLNLARYIKPQYLAGYCFTGETEFLTRDGVTTFSEAVGTTQQVLTMKEPLGPGASPVTKAGYWVDAPIESFGEQPVLSVTLRRASQRKVIRATPEHEWFASTDARSAARTKARKVTTADLRPGMALASLMPMPVAKRGTVPSPYGIAAGAVFGDGHRGPHGASIDLWGDKDAQLLRYFEGNPMSAVKTEGGVLGTRVRSLPSSWKGVPSLDEGPSYLLGWLAGYIAADGHVTKRGAISLSSSNRDHLVLAQTVANRLGISTLPITHHMRTGKGTEPTPLFKLPFVGETFPEAALVIAEHRSRLVAAAPKFTATRWVVESVEDHGEAEEVFCAVVPETETFALADYVWVHNCANRHKDALGFWPGEHRGSNSADVLVAAAGTPLDGETMAPALRLVGEPDLLAPPDEWFEDPHLLGPSPIAITEEGRFFGHLAQWGTCHIGFDGVCIEPPHSAQDYAQFKTKSVVTESGQTIPVGVLTMDTGHADINLRARPAAAHYDNTGTVTALVNVGEDEFGIWVAGAIPPNTSPEKIYKMRGSVLSGDWRDIAGNLELVAALHVNVGGFPVPRVAIAASGGHQTALVAAGLVLTAGGEPVPNISIEEVVEKTMLAVEEKRANKAQMEALAARRAAERKARMDELAARAGRK